ncbi:MAG: undecaprenyldiphospho-muramoylpentapeptide beta-N-acetylglucosaminyltransferase [Dehalococcoidales bacterium]|nr:undecaprenyldiphospho-muramoylpentapeptide beta-N-acetylglucosaminyltransferase [Dehalococcoidales bacterium]
MRIIATGGGTGGHVYPALSIISALRKRLDEQTGEHLEVLYVGSEGGLEEGIVTRAGLAFRSVPSGAVVGRSPVKIVGNLARTVAGMVASVLVIRSFGPQAVLATGGYVCVPVVLGAWLSRVPSLIFLPDMAPGVAVRFLAQFASRLAVSFQEARRQLPAEKTVATGYPVRPDLFSVDREKARAQLDLSADLPVVLVLGGSRGAHSINVAVSEALPALLPKCQIVHVAGPGGEEELREKAAGLPEELRGRYRLHAYLHEELPSALGAADVVVSRAGASVMGEYPAVGAASILIPYPYAGAHQRLNAQQLVEKGAALQIDDAQLGTGILEETVLGLLNDPERLARMREAARQLAQPGASAAIGDILRQLAYQGSLVGNQR